MEKGSLKTSKKYASDTALIIPNERVAHKLTAKSEPGLVRSTTHPLLDDIDDSVPRYEEYLFAAETLENIVNEGTFVGTINSKFQWHPGANQVSREMSDKVLKLVYGTMKCKINSK